MVTGVGARAWAVALCVLFLPCCAPMTSHSPPPSPPPCLRFFSPLLHSQQYSFDDQNYLFMLPIVLHRAPTRKNILGLTMQHFKMLHKVQADVSAEEVMHPPAWLPLPLLSLACFSATGHATCEAVPATTRYCGDGQT